MTAEQIRLEFAHLEIDHNLRAKDQEYFQDPAYSEWEKEVGETDAKRSYAYAFSAVKSQSPATYENWAKEWEDVEDEE